MCARYHSVLDAARLKQFFKSRIARDIADLKPDVFPGYSPHQPCLASRWGSPGWKRARVGTFSYMDKVLPTRKLERAAAPSQLARVATTPDAGRWSAIFRSSVHEQGDEDDDGDGDPEK